MKKSTLSVLAIAMFAGISVSAQHLFNGVEATTLCKGSRSVEVNRQSRVPSFIWFREDSKFPAATIQDVLRPALHMQLADGMRSKLVQKDEIGMTHERFTQTYNSIPVEGGEYIVHSKNGIVQTTNGMWFDGIAINTTPALTKEEAIAKATAFVNADVYRWELAGDEAMLKQTRRNLNATYYPSGELVVVCRNGDIMAKDYVLAWKLDIYAAEPMSRQWIYVDAQTGAVVHSKNRIHHIDVPANGNTMYSGNQNFTCDDQGNGTYRLRQNAHGDGVETYNLNNATSTAGAVDFTNNSTTWTSTANDDHAALDAHWGAEGTYDFFLNEMGRNGLDNQGMLMVSYVHYGTNYNNAFWNGTEMTYGDGSGQAGGFNPLTAIDVCGHEFSHGVTEFSSNLDYQDESGALNESFSDIYGTAIEFYKKPATANFLMGEEIVVTPGALRSLQNPNAYGDPDCHSGTNWYTGTADNGGVHTNSGVQNYWYYLCSQGGSGTNDLGDAFNVTGFGWYDACRVAFRNNTFYLVSTSEYADSRVGAIQAAQDFFGACSPEVIAVTNAWYACGVGPVFSATVAASFNGDVLTSCSVPTTVNFTNTSSNATTALWNFGDSTTDTAYNPTHIYTNPGTYNVTLTSSSSCGTNTTVQNAYIVISTPTAPAANGTQICTPGSVTLNATGSGQLDWYSQAIGGTAIASGGSYTTPTLNSTTTYYVENMTSQAPVSVGPADNTFGTGGQHNNTSTQYEEFTVFQNCTLATGDVYAGSAGNKTFTLWDGAGNVINTYTVNVPTTGLNTVTLNIPLTPGQYRLGGTQMNLYRNNASASYPYTSPGVVSITGSSAGGGFYYYLYNWTMNLDGCHSPRTPVTVVVGSANIALNTTPYDTTCANASSFALTGGSPTGGTYSGPGVNAGTFDPVAAGLGLHTITYTYTDTAGCTGTANSQVLVDVCNGISSAVASATMALYPNPAEGDFTIEFTNSGDVREANLTIVNSFGQAVSMQQLTCTPGTNRWIIGAENLATGIYFINFVAGDQTFSRKLEIQ